MLLSIFGDLEYQVIAYSRCPLRYKSSSLISSREHLSCQCLWFVRLWGLQISSDLRIRFVCFVLPVIANPLNFLPVILPQVTLRYFHVLPFLTRPNPYQLLKTCWTDKSFLPYDDCFGDAFWLASFRWSTSDLMGRSMGTVQVRIMVCSTHLDSGYRGFELWLAARKL